MTDRELLELAAKAGISAGMPLHFGPHGLQPAPHWQCGFCEWLPLTDDGDALRLAVKLRMAIYPPEDEGDGATISTPGVDGEWITEECTNDVYAATRRAIVRAAAEIGKAMQ